VKTKIEKVVREVSQLRRFYLDLKKAGVIKRTDPRPAEPPNPTKSQSSGK
jgi:hypothetical protein